MAIVIYQTDVAGKYRVVIDVDPKLVKRLKWFKYWGFYNC